MSFYTPLLINLFNDLEADPPIYEDLVGEAMAKVNENFAAIDGAMNTALNGLDPQNSVTTKTLSAAPTTGLTVGARYIVKATPTSGDPWEGHTNHIAELTATSPAYAWEFITPNKGFNLTVEDENLEYVYTDSGWASRPSTVSHNALNAIQGGSNTERYHVSEAVSIGLAAGYLPASGEKAALAGTQGTPGDGNRFVTTTDARLATIVLQTVTGTAGLDLVKYNLCYSNTADSGKWHKCSPSGTSDEARVQGIVYSADIDEDDTGTIVISRAVLTDETWTWTPGAPLYLGAGGTITETSTGSNVSIGFALSPTEIQFTPSEPVTAASVGLGNVTNNAQLTTAQLAAASGVASLDVSSKVVQDPANATATKTASKIPIADGSGYINAWIQTGSTSGTMCAGDDSRLSDAGLIIDAATAKNTPVDADCLALSDSAATPTAGILKKLSWSYVKSVLKTYFDGLYVVVAGDIGGTVTSPTVTGIHSGITALAISTIADGQFLKRVGTDIVSATAGAFNVALISFTQATSSPALLLDPPNGAVLTKIVVVVDTAGSTGSPTCSVGVSGTAGRDMATTDSDLKIQGTYIVEPYTACGTDGANISLTITPDSQTFSCRCYLHYAVSA
jgi:hypothetical protein